MNESQNMPRQLFFVKFSKWLFSWRTVRRAVIALAALVTMAALVVTEENWRGKRDWEKYKSEQEARGERFDLASFTPKPVPPEQNFYATPFLAPLLEYDIINGEVHWRDSNGVARARSLSIVSGAIFGFEEKDLKSSQKYLRSNTNFPARPEPQEPATDVLFALKKFDPILAELRAASERPAAVYTQRPDRDLEALVGLFGVMRTMAQAASLHALASLEASHPADALADVQFVLRVGNALRGEPTLIAQLVRIAILNLALEPVRQGLARHRWPEAQLQQLQTLLMQEDLLADYALTIRGERAFGNELMGQYIAGNYGVMGEQSPGFKWLGFLAPRGLFYQNQIVLNRLHEQLSQPAVNAAAHRAYPDKTGTNALANAVGRRTPYNLFGRMLFPALQKVVISFAHTQNKFDQAVIACALERHRLARGNHPETLAALLPQFIAKIPGDVLSGQPPNYRRTGDETFLLYSVGWNEKDDGGTTALSKGGKEIRESGDWLWQLPTK